MDEQELKYGSYVYTDFRANPDMVWIVVKDSEYTLYKGETSKEYEIRIDTYQIDLHPNFINFDEPTPKHKCYLRDDKDWQPNISDLRIKLINILKMEKIC